MEVGWAGWLLRASGCGQVDWWVGGQREEFGVNTNKRRTNNKEFPVSWNETTDQVMQRSHKQQVSVHTRRNARKHHKYNCDARVVFFDLVGCCFVSLVKVVAVPL
jgi:hypothetical protein